MGKYYTTLLNGQWKVYIFLFMKKGTNYKLYFKIGITEYRDIDARMFFNNLKEEDSFLKHFDIRPMWSSKYSTKEEAEKVEKKLLKYFGKQVDMGFKTSGHTEVRKYNQQLWMDIKDKLYNKTNKYV
jgi:hypothetical protein|tara:strand:+ start:55 stop:435 length:381 start_codon:yes stop_codon:yes gene_type:complete